MSQEKIARRPLLERKGKRVLVVLMTAALGIALYEYCFDSYSAPLAAPYPKKSIREDLETIGYTGPFQVRDVQLQQLTGALFMLQEGKRTLSEAELFDVMGYPDVVDTGNGHAEYVYYYDRNGTKWVCQVSLEKGYVSYFSYNVATANDYSAFKPFIVAPQK